MVAGEEDADQLIGSGVVKAMKAVQVQGDSAHVRREPPDRANLGEYDLAGGRHRCLQKKLDADGNASD